MKLRFLHALPFDGRMWDDTTAAWGGPTDAPDLFARGASIEEWASSVLDQAGSEEFVVVGCSVGGSCALEVARQAPEQVAAIVLVGAKAEVRPEPALRDEAVCLLETEGMSAAWERYWLPLFGDETSAAVKESARDWAMEQDVSVVVNGVRAFHDRSDLSAFAAGWNKPLIGISGATDVAPAPAKLRALTQRPNRAFHVVANSGHYVNLEQPEVFDRLLSEAFR